MNTILYVVGARPNFIKMAPVVAALRGHLREMRHVLVHTGQHYDPMLSQIFFDELDLPAPDHMLGVGSGDHGAQTARTLERIERVLKEEMPAAVVVAGDVNSTLAAALAAAKLNVPIAHIESGLRSFDRTMPEEINRVLVDQLSWWCFTHSPEARDNLLREGIEAECIHPEGNTMIDMLVRLRPRIAASQIHETLAIERRNYVLVTLHRPALVDGELLRPTLQSLARLAVSAPVVFPIHPRTQAKIPAEFSAPGLMLVDPVGYLDFLALEEHALAVITDSGGVQEETTYLRVPCFTLRATTERPITVSQGTNTILGLDPQAIERVPELIATVPIPLAPPDGWDGQAAGRIAPIVARELAEAVGAATEVEPTAGSR